MVERPPPRPILDDFGMDSLLGPADGLDPLGVMPGSPPSPSVGTPAIYSPTYNHYSPTGVEQQQQPQPQQQGQGQGQGQKSPVSPRPYLPKRSSSSIMGVMASSPSGSGGGSGVASPSTLSVAGPSTSRGGSPNLLSQVPMFVKRRRETEVVEASSSAAGASSAI